MSHPQPARPQRADEDARTGAPSALPLALSRLRGRLPRALDVLDWPLTVRVVAVTVLLSSLAILAVGAYLTSVISDGLFEQRRDRVLDESQSMRDDLSLRLRELSGDTGTQQQDAATRFVRDARSDAGAVAGREAALVPVGATSGVSVIATDPSISAMLTDDMARAIEASPDSLSWRSVQIPASGAGTRAEPGLLVGARVSEPGVGAYDLYILYSLQQEQQTLLFVQRVMIGGAIVLLAMMVGIAIAIARLVGTPLRRAALAAERLAQGDLTSRVEVSGSDELARVGRSFNAMAESLEQKVADLTELSRVQQRFVADVSHELRTPLTTIRMATAVLDDARRSSPSAFGPDVARTTELLSAQVRRFEALLTDLLEISRFDAGAAVLEAQREDVAALARRAVEDVRVLAATRGSTLVTRIRPGSLSAVVDGRRIDRILRNLLTNALEHGAGGPVLIEVAGDEHSVAVLVQDHGSGISPEDAARVFDRFWRADPARARTIGGTGLGLAIAVEDARLHGGWLQAWGQVGQGAVFRLTLPRRPGGHLSSAPLRLERPFEDARFVATRTGEIDLRSLDLSASSPEDADGAVRPDALPSGWEDEGDGTSDAEEPSAADGPAAGPDADRRPS